MTINQALSFLKILKQRKAELENLRSQVSTSRTDSYFGDNYDKKRDSVVTPQFDVKLVDRKVVELANAIYLIDSSIKQANATTKVDLEIDRDKLLEPLS